MEFPPRETSPVAKSGEKRMFSQAIGGQVRCIMGDVQVAY